MSGYEYRHVVLFEETNALGNVYYVNHIRWQGRCREAFLREHAPEVAQRLGRDLVFVTMRCSCEYFIELAPFDEVIMRMSLEHMLQNRLHLHFAYCRSTGEGEELVAVGEQELALLSRNGEQLRAAPLPPQMVQAMQPFRREEAAARSRYEPSLERH